MPRIPIKAHTAPFLTLRASVLLSYSTSRTNNDIYLYGGLSRKRSSFSDFIDLLAPFQQGLGDHRKLLRPTLDKDNTEDLDRDTDIATNGLIMMDYSG